MNTDWTRLLRKKMHEHQGAPLPIDWAQIDALADQKAVNCRGRSYGRVQAWQWLSAAAVLLLMVSGAFATMLKKELKFWTTRTDFL